MLIRIRFEGFVELAGAINNASGVARDFLNYLQSRDQAAVDKIADDIQGVAGAVQQSDEALEKALKEG